MEIFLNAVGIFVFLVDGYVVVLVNIFLSSNPWCLFRKKILVGRPASSLDRVIKEISPPTLSCHRIMMVFFMQVCIGLFEPLC